MSFVRRLVEDERGRWVAYIVVFLAVMLATLVVVLTEVDDEVDPAPSVSTAGRASLSRPEEDTW